MADLNHFDSSTQAPLLKQFRVRKGVQNETLAANATLTKRSANFLNLDPGGADRTVTLLAEADGEGLVFVIYNAGSSGEELTVQDDTPTTVATLNAGEGCVVGCDGSSWYLMVQTYAEGSVQVLDSGTLKFGVDGDILYTHNGTDSVVVSNAASGTVDYHDDVLHVVDPADPAKEMRIDSGNITTANTRVLTMADRNVDLDFAVQRAFVEVTTAQVKALNATPITLVAAPGATKYLEFVSAFFWLDFESAAYDGIATGEDLEIRYTDGSGQEVASVEATGFMDATADEYALAAPASAAVGTAALIQPVANAVLALTMSVAEIATGDSPLKVEVLYRVRNINPAA